MITLKPLSSAVHGDAVALVLLGEGRSPANEMPVTLMDGFHALALFGQENQM